MLIAGLVPALARADEYSDAQKAVEEKDYVKALELIRVAIAKEPQDIDRLRLGAKVYLEMNILDTAAQYAKRVYKDDDDVKENVLLYANALIATNQAAEACVAIKKFRKGVDDVEMALAHVDALVAADSLVSAELVATTARSKFSKSPLAYLALGNLYFNWKPRPILENAADNYRAALDLDNNNVEAHFNLAICYWKMRNRESDDALATEYLTKCLDEWTTVSTLDPKNARAWFEQGKIYYYAKKYTKAVSALKEYRVLRPVGSGEPMASWFLGESLYKLAKCDEAQQHLEDAARQVDSLKSKVALMLARCNYDAKKWGECAKKYDEAVVFESSWEPTDYWNHGTALILAGDTVKAINVMLVASDKAPKQCAAMFRLGFLLQVRKQYASSSKVFLSRLANCSDSNDTRVNILIGNNFFADSLVDSAITYYQRALTISPKSMWAQQLMGESYLLKGDEVIGDSLLNGVIANAQTSTSNDEKRYGIAAINALNNFDIKKRDYKGIVDRCKIGTQINPQSAVVWLYLGIGYQGLKDLDNAKEAYQAVLKIDPNNQMAKKNLQSLGK
jgi:tetratricopeptide (TPR) repeat protein